MRPSTHSRCALTIVELLIVVAIIAILVAILMPSLAGAREQSKFVACRVNLKNIGAMIAIYAHENAEQVPRGPSHYGNPNPLLAPYIGTSQVWMGDSFDGMSWQAYINNPDAVTDFVAPPQYVGLGLLTRKPGLIGNEFLFCPSSDQQDKTRQAPQIGAAGKDAYSSYLYRQLDLMSSSLFLNARLDTLAGDGIGGANPCVFLNNPQGDPADPDNQFILGVPVAALALDYNSRGPGAARRSNHRSKTVNIVFRDGSVIGLENHPQIVQREGPQRVPWATVGSWAYPDVPSILAELDRIIGTADLAFRSETPWTLSPP